MRLSKFQRKKEEIRLEKKFEPKIPPNSIEAYDVGEVKVAITDRYELLEPPLPANFNEILEDSVIRFTGFNGSGDEEEKLLRAFIEVATERNMDPETANSAWYHVKNACLGVGRITALLKDPNVEDVSCSGPGLPIFVYHTRYGYIPTNLLFSHEELFRFIHSLAQRTGFVLTADNPVLDSTLPDGSRVNATISVSREPSFTIRRAKTQPMTPTKLIRDRIFPPEIFALLWLAVENKCSVMFIGGTASGKTTSMNATAFCIPPNSKIVSIEDTYELVLFHENWTSMITRSGFTQLDLLKAALRQRPEFIIVGESRGLEVREMFSAMGIGHTVLTTFHGNNAQSVARRLLGEPFLIKSDQFSLLDFIVTLSMEGKSRKCIEVFAIGEGDERLVADIFGTKIYNGKEINLDSALQKIANKGTKSESYLKKELERRANLLVHAPDDAKDFFEFMKRFYMEKSG